MRIIAGQWRGRPLVAPKGEQTRPTADRTRETLFSMLVSRLGSFEGLRIADLYAGSGALAFEALMRRDISMNIKERVYQAAFVFLVLFAVMVIYNDLMKTIPGLADKLP